MTPVEGNHTTATINKLKQQACNRKPDEHGDGVVY